jgi:hypothetical protein
MTVTVELKFTCTQLTQGELRIAIEETFGNFCDQNINFVTITDPNTGELHGECLVGFSIKE